MTALTTHPILYWTAITALVSITILAASVLNRLIRRHSVAISRPADRKFGPIERK